MDRHRGTRIQIWLDDTDLAKLDELAAQSLRGTRADAIRSLINGRAFHDRSYKDAVARLGQIGGLMKKHKIGTAEQAKEVVETARYLRRELWQA